MGKAAGCSRRAGGWLAHGHRSCSTSFSGQFNFVTGLLCTSMMFKACMEAGESRWPRCAMGSPQGGQEPSEVSPCRGGLVHPALRCLSLAGSWQQNQGDFREKPKCGTVLAGKEARWRKWSCSRGQWSLAEMNWRRLGRWQPLCWLVLHAAEGLQPLSPTPVYADKMQSVRLEPDIAWQESFSWAGCHPAWLTG